MNRRPQPFDAFELKEAIWSLKLKQSTSFPWLDTSLLTNLRWWGLNNRGFLKEGTLVQESHQFEEESQDFSNFICGSIIYQCFIYKYEHSEEGCIQ